MTSGSIAACSLVAALQWAGVPPAAAQAGPFVLPSQGCPMAHCDARMSDQARTRVPDVGQLVHLDPAQVGNGNWGLGCSSNLLLVACTLRGDPALQSNLVVYDADGRRIWEDGGLLGETAWMSVPLVGADGTVVAADRDHVLRADPASGRVLWMSAKPDPGDPISPVPAGSDGSLLFVATSRGGDGVAELSVWDLPTGALLAHMPLADATTGRRYVTRNTPAVRGNRVYVLAESEPDADDGRLVAIDLCESSACGGRGQMSVGWSFSFKGPSGASPLVIGTRIFFDGRPTPRSGRLFALNDRGSAPRLLWQREFPSILTASAAQDPRGGLWLAPAGAAHTLLRLNADTGATEQQVVLSEVLGLVPGYTMHSVLSVYRSAAGQPVLVGGLAHAADPTLPSLLAAIDVGAVPAGSALWSLVLAPDGQANSAASRQFPAVVTPGGARRIVFTGLRSGIHFVGMP